MNAVRQYLPFSPAKKGPLSDLDKSGESFFPTWYEGALTQVKPMSRAIAGAMGQMNDQMQAEFGTVGLEAFTGGGKQQVTVTHEHVMTGKIEVEGDGGNKETFDLTVQKLQEQQDEYWKDLKQAFRRK
ncbi:hypothetical protein FBHYGVHD_CDS0031 [Staphylococcus phage MVC_VPHSA1]|uniref:Uncharacterized protein n=1 Tax=Staphylococcus phage MVC_VPHSA1 TaxID=3088876 RepID=A0ABZ0QYK4_9CAUD|nr:hypothetical protein FBHYGVHD_CDS0031 [Staphylococcus phage MVC_VPHSA1]